MRSSQNASCLLRKGIKFSSRKPSSECVGCLSCARRFPFHWCEMHAGLVYGRRRVSAGRAVFFPAPKRTWAAGIEGDLWGCAFVVVTKINCEFQPLLCRPGPSAHEGGRSSFFCISPSPWALMGEVFFGRTQQAFCISRYFSPNTDGPDTLA